MCEDVAHGECQQRSLTAFVDFCSKQHRCGWHRVGFLFQTTPLWMAPRRILVPNNTAVDGTASDSSLIAIVSSPECSRSPS